MFQKIPIKTMQHSQFVNITVQIQKAVAQSKIKNGLCVLFVPHTTAAVTINEAADPDVARDIQTTLSNLIPANKDYFHLEGNADAHIKSVLTGASQSILIANGKLKLGTWQGIFFCEFDGPRQREVWVKLQSD